MSICTQIHRKSYKNSQKKKSQKKTKFKSAVKTTNLEMNTSNVVSHMLCRRKWPMCRPHIWATTHGLNPMTAIIIMNFGQQKYVTDFAQH